MEVALGDVGAKPMEWSADRRRVTARITGGFWSRWGSERLTATVDDSGEVQVRSVSSNPIQLFDSGKNQENCQEFLESVARRIHSAGAA
jgi:hypothetical protein